MSPASPSPYGGRGPLVLGITWSETGLAFILIILRAQTASIRPRESLVDRLGVYRLRWDFIWVILAFVLALTGQISLTISVYYGLGNHQRLISPPDLVKLSLWNWIAQAISILDLAVARIAVIAFLLSLQNRTEHWSRYFLYFIGVVQAVLNLITVVLIFEQCSPTARLWDISIPGTCDGIIRCSQIGYIQSAIGACSDFFLAAYPIYIVRRIQLMKRSTKIGLCFIMGGGLIAGIAAIFKGISIAYITEIQDKTYVIAKLAIWVVTEMWFIIIFGSIPTLRMLFVRFSQDIKSAVGHGRPRSGGMQLHDRPTTQRSESRSGSGTVEINGSRYASSGESLDLRRWEREFGDGRILVTSGITVISEER